MDELQMYSTYYWYRGGMDHRKIAVGIPTYSHTYKLLWSFWHTVYAPSTGYSQYGGDTTFSTVL